MSDFLVQADVHANIRELRRVLGSATRTLSPADLARLLNERDPSRRRAQSTIWRWENESVQPDYESVRLMAELASVTFEEFALGRAEAPPAAARLRAVSERAVPYGRQRQPDTATKSGAPLSPMVRAAKVPGEEKPQPSKKQRGA